MAEIDRDIQERDQDAYHHGCKQVIPVIEMKFFIAQRKMIITVQQAGGYDHLQQVIEQGFHLR